MIKLSIIVPIYNVEKYIRTCIESIFSQGLSDDVFELILVNDGTPDKSMEVISDIIHNHNNIQIINQSNQGPSIARNNGLRKASGEYIHFVDSDDLLVDYSLYTLLDEVFKSKADLIVADFEELSNEEIGLKEIIIPKEIIINKETGENIYLKYLSPFDCHIWHTIFRREFLQENKILFPPHIYYEDIPFMHKCYLMAHSCLRISIPIYIYRKGNTMSITSRFDMKSGMDFSTALAKTWELTQCQGLSKKVKNKLKENIYISFSYLTYSVVHDIRHHKERIDIIKSIKRNAPDMHFKNGFRQRSVTFMYKKMPYSYLALRVIYANKIEQISKRVKKLYKRFKKN